MMYKFLKELFPICRSITGEGNRQTLQKIKELLPQLSIKEVPSGEDVLDWTIPDEWNITGGYIEDAKGNKIVDFAENNLYIMGYSTPVDVWLPLEELKEHIYTQVDQPEVIPYVTSYYRDKWGFCMSYNQFESLNNGTYHAVIKSEKRPGVLNYGEIIIPGEEMDSEVFLSTYICHPSMANDNISSVCVLTFLARWLLEQEKLRYTYRIVFAPETIGAIAYIDKNLDTLRQRVKYAFCLSCMGDDNYYSAVLTRKEDTQTDALIKNSLIFSPRAAASKIYSFLERGSDERQYGAPGVDLPIVGLCRSKYHTFPEYHTSADNLDFVSEQGLNNSLSWMKELISVIEMNMNYRVMCLGEPQLGKRGLYPTISQKNTYGDARTIQNFVAYADGSCSLVELANQIGKSAYDLLTVVERLKEAKLIEVV